MNFRQPIIKWKEGILIRNGMISNNNKINELIINNNRETRNQIEPKIENRKKKNPLRIL